MTQVETPATFPRSARLLTPSAFTAVFEKRSVRRGRFFHLHLGPLPTVAAGSETPAELAAAPTSRLGIAVPKKLLKLAVHRNVVKRIAREVFRHHRQQLDGRDYILRLATKLDPKRQPLDRRALAQDVLALLAGRQTSAKRNDGPTVSQKSAAPGSNRSC